MLSGTTGDDGSSVQALVLRALVPNAPSMLLMGLDAALHIVTTVWRQLVASDSENIINKSELGFRLAEA